MLNDGCKYLNQSKENYLSWVQFLRDVGSFVNKLLWI